MHDIHCVNTEINNVRKTRKMKFPKKLSIFASACPYRWSSWHGFRGNIKDFFLTFKCAWQRMTKGYCTCDTFSGTDNIVEHAIGILTEMRNNTCSYPDSEFESMEAWLQFLDDILDDLEYSIMDTDEINYLRPQAQIIWDRYPLEKGTFFRRSNYTVSESKIMRAYYDEEDRIVRDQERVAAEAMAALFKHGKSVWY